MYRTLFLTFIRIGAFTVGGGYAMLPLIEREVVGRGWISRQDFFDLFTVSQSLPGIFAVNISIFLGYRLKKITGSLVCVLGAILPSFLIILSIALFFTHIQDNVWVERIFKGFRPAAVALIAVPCLTAAQSVGLTWKTALIALAAVLPIWLLGVSPVYVVIAAAVGGLIYGLRIKKG
ncbi:MAG: chromate transporter [Tannerellaceae bacterium]|jgi:chromate transporter|nr:chromate transporter [Tannerellaceae bacterium]